MNYIERDLSLKLYDVMDKLGVSKNIRKLYQDSSAVREIIVNIDSQLKNNLNRTYNFGSSSEGTKTKGFKSDVDVVGCDGRFPVIDNVIAAPPGDSYLMITDDHTYPGYVKLQLVRDATPLTSFNADIPDGHCLDTENRICKKHFVISVPGEDKLERHGPADAQPGRGKAPPLDFVYALQCKEIPVCAREWMNRRRLCNWPSRENMFKMKDLGCFVVGVGHSTSRDRAIEWRISLSLQERIIMFNLNTTQHKCYVLLKMIKKDIIQAELEESISSYHCKTCLFYVIENTSVIIWRPENLIACVRLCLMILLEWAVSGYCPNYFVVSENMFEKPQFHATRDRLIEMLRNIIADDISFILRLQCDNIKNHILQTEILENNITGTLVYLEYMKMYATVNGFSFCMYKLANENPDTCGFVKTLNQHIERLNTTRVIAEHSERHTREAISYILPVLHHHIAQRLASLACKGQTQAQSRHLLHRVIHHSKLGNFDLMTLKLTVVSSLMQLQKYHVCEAILGHIEQDLTIYTHAVCECQTIGGFETNVYLFEHIDQNNISLKTAIRRLFIGCVRFLRCDIAITPIPVQYEMFRSVNTNLGTDDIWFDWAVVDGKVYLYFLQYLVFSLLKKSVKKQIATDKLVRVLEDDPNLGHKETACNLLGWIHQREGRIEEALLCFVESWKIRPNNNVAIWHLCISLYNYHKLEVNKVAIVPYKSSGVG